jgi:YidC/Oxa1 family membrane protein insertase
MERRVLVAIFLSFVVLYAYQTLVVKPAPVRPGGLSTPATTVPGTGPASSSSTVPSDPAVTPERPSATELIPAATPLIGEPTERDVRVETRDVIAVFTNRGARLKSWRLKRFLDQQKEPQELVATDLSGSQPLPFSLRTANEALTATLNGATYAVSGLPADGAAQSAPAEVSFEYRDSAAVHVTKTFRFEPDSFVVTVRAVVTEGDREIIPAIEWGPAVGGQTTVVSRYVQKAEGLLFQNGSIQRLAAKAIAAKATYEGDFRYAGVDDQYFLTAIVGSGQQKITYQPLSIPPPAGSKDPARELMSFSIVPASSGSAIKFFAGPKDVDVLAGTDQDLVRAINFGWFAFLVVPLLRSLKWINAYVGNYGWSIIILTILINAVMFPLRHKSVVSMRKMQEIQPEVKAIQDRYSKLKATDPAKQKMNQELMALYKERGVNPASGCVPMLLTFPVLFAFYSLLSTAIELRGAPFVGWIHDLSQHDPLYITPVLMGVSQVWQQRITPAAGVDPAQQKVMMMMPVVFTFMFLWAPSGVAVYWFVSNMWAIGQQYLTNYLIGPPMVRNVRPPAERRMKRAGAGKTEAAARES